MEVEPLGEGLFRDVNSGERVVITERDGLRHVFVENWPDHAFTEIAWYEIAAISCFAAFSCALRLPLGHHRIR